MTCSPVRSFGSSRPILGTATQVRPSTEPRYATIMRRKAVCKVIHRGTVRKVITVDSTLGHHHRLVTLTSHPQRHSSELVYHFCNSWVLFSMTENDMHVLLSSHTPNYSSVMGSFYRPCLDCAVQTLCLLGKDLSTRVPTTPRTKIERSV